jgi:transcriptional regulator with XRE-family HTH domain
MIGENFGEKVRFYRTQRGWGQAELARRMKTSVPTISRIENGGRDVSRQELVALAGVFQLSLSTFVEHPIPFDVSSEDSETLVVLMRVSRLLPRPVLRRVRALAEAVEPYFRPPPTKSVETLDSL